MKANGRSKAGIRGGQGGSCLALFYPHVQAFSNHQVEQVVYFSHIIFFLMASAVPSSITFAFQAATWLH